MDTLLETIEEKPVSKKDEIHKNLKITFAVIGIFALSLSALVNYYTLKRISK
jgi:hypothetical protein